MTIDEAIKDCEKRAEKNEEECKNWAYGASLINDDENRKKQYQKHAEMWHECANDQRQLAEWLSELKGLQENEDVKEVFKNCGTCKYQDIDADDYPCDRCCHRYINQYVYDDKREVNADEDSD